MQKIFINIASKIMTENIYEYYLESYNELYLKYDTKTFIFYEGEKIHNKIYEDKLAEKGVFIYNYLSSDNLKEQVINLKNNYDIVYINTFTELLIDIAADLKKIIGQKVSKNDSLFRNKYIQRKLLQDYNPNITVKFLEKKLDDINLEEIEDFIGYPFILKPSTGIQSAGVSKIETKSDFEEYILGFKAFLGKAKDKGYNISQILVEEFVDGEMYSIDYFVSQKGDISISKPVKVEIAQKLGIKDFFNYSRIVSKEVEEELKNNNLRSFIEQTVKATDIKNTFVHHEFKLNSKGELKTIELNGRIGGYRLEIYKQGYNLNLFNFIFSESDKNIDLKDNFAVIAIYPEKDGILLDFNRSILKEIEKLESIYKISLTETFLGKKIGLTKNGFGKIGGIKLKHSDSKKFYRDYIYIERNYKKLTLMK